jgi:hypothetical protein
MRFIDIYRYATDWSCEHKRAFWGALLLMDGPLLTIDFSILYVWFWAPEALTYFGQGLGIVASGSGIYLTWLRIKQVRRDLNKKKDDG